MEENKRFDDTISGMSLQDILDEINAEHVNDDDVISIDDVLAEFSNDQKPKDNDLNRASKAPPSKETEIPVPEPKEEAVTIDNAEPLRGEDTIISVWDSGLQEDITLSDFEVEEPKNKKRKTSKFAETFDTFTRSELFEDKSAESVLETRSVEEIIKENTKVSRLLGLRAFVLFILSVASCYLAFSEPIGLYLPRLISYLVHPYRYLFLTAFFEIIAMLLSVDVMSRGLARLLKFRPNVESAIAFSSFATLAHVISIMAAPQWRGWLPYSCITVVTLFFVIYGKWINARALCRVGKTVKSAKRPSAVYVENIYGENHVIKQTTEDTKEFISHINDKDASYTFWKYLSPVVIVASIVFAAVASFGTSTPQHFFWALAGISSVSTPFFIMMSFALPFSVTSKSLASIGAAISGWYSATNLSKKANVVVCDNDIFPKGTVTLHGLKVLGDYSLEQTVCYVASVISETKSGLDYVFSDLLKSRYGVKAEVSNLRYHESGGVEAEVSGDNVLIGTVSFMLRSGVHLNAGIGSQNAVFIAINREPAGVFNINYKANVEVERALHKLVKKRVPVILAVRDFNMLPMMVERAFELRDGVLDYPEIEERLDLSSTEQFVTDDAVALITRSGLHPLSAAVLAAKKLRRATIRNIFLTTAASLIGMLLMFNMMFIQKPALIPPHTVFVYMFLWFFSTYMLSLRVKR